MKTVYVSLLLLLALTLCPKTVECGWHHATSYYDYVPNDPSIANIAWKFDSQYFNNGWYLEGESKYGYAAQFYGPTVITFPMEGETYSPTLRQGWSRLWPNSRPTIRAHDVDNMEFKLSIANLVLPEGIRVKTTFTAWDYENYWDGGLFVRRKTIEKIPCISHHHQVKYVGMNDTGWVTKKEKMEPLCSFIVDKAVGGVIGGCSVPGITESLVSKMIAELLKYLIQNGIQDSWVDMDNHVISQERTHTWTYTFNEIIKYQSVKYPGLKGVDGGYWAPNVQEYHPEIIYGRVIVETILKLEGKIVAVKSRTDYTFMAKKDDLGNPPEHYDENTALDHESPSIGAYHDEYKAKVARRHLDDKEAIIWKPDMSDAKVAWPVYPADGGTIGGMP